MKTKLFFIAVATLVLLNCQTSQAQLKFGAHAALNIETQTEAGELWNNANFYQGYLIGGFMDYRMGKTLSLQTELNYQKKGRKYDNNSEGSETVVRNEFNYITIPLLAKANIHDNSLGDKWDLSFFSGPYIGFLTSAYSNSETGNDKTTVNIEDQAENTDFGLIFGGGVSYKLRSGDAIIAELRYQMGLNQVDKQDPDLRNKGMGITIGYRF